MKKEQIKYVRIRAIILSSLVARAGSSFIYPKQCSSISDKIALKIDQYNIIICR